MWHSWSYLCKSQVTHSSSRAHSSSFHPFLRMCIGIAALVEICPSFKLASPHSDFAVLASLS